MAKATNLLPPEGKQEKPESLIKKFECWKADAIFEWDIDKSTGDKIRKMVDVKKMGMQPISVTNIEQRHADELNSHVENSKLYYFIKK